MIVSITILVIIMIWAIKRGIETSYENGYLDACKDFYKGKVKYDLIEDTDGSKTWKKIEKWIMIVSRFARSMIVCSCKCVPV